MGTLLKRALRKTNKIDAELDSAVNVFTSALKKLEGTVSKYRTLHGSISYEISGLQSHALALENKIISTGE